MSIFSQLIRTTARVETVDTKGGVSIGTSFFLAFVDNNVPCFLLVSNRHVLANKEIARVYVTRRVNGVDAVQSVIVTDCPGKIIMHPDPEVDLAALPWGGVTEANFNDSPPGWLNLKEENFLPEEVIKDLSPYESLAMIGYPNGIWDPHQNIPIIRSGNTATPLSVDFQGKKQFLMNSACFPGSSGSPIFLANEGSFTTSKGLHIGSRTYLAGILSATYTQSLTGKIVEIPIPTTDRLTSVAQLPIHLGICIKAAELKGIVAAARQKIAKAA